jgi:hypothetical protein
VHSEIKEIPELHRQPHKEYKPKHQRVLSVSDPRDLFRDLAPQDLTPRQVGDLIVQKLSKYHRRYSAGVRRDSDILLYVNLLHHFHTAGSVPEASIFEGYGWRSVCVLQGGSTSMVLFAAPSAPELLRRKVGKVYR